MVVALMVTDFNEVLQVHLLHQPTLHSRQLMTWWQLCALKDGNLWWYLRHLLIYGSIWIPFKEVRRQLEAPFRFYPT